MWTRTHIVLHIERGPSIERIAVLRPHTAEVEGSSSSLSTSILSHLQMTLPD